jgi:hypothetical protein
VRTLVVFATRATPAQVDASVFVQSTICTSIICTSRPACSEIQYGMQYGMLGDMLLAGPWDMRCVAECTACILFVLNNYTG